MKQYAAFLFLLLLCGSNAFGQFGVYDTDFKKPPSISLEHLDSVKQVKIYEVWAGGMNRDPIKGQGYLEIEVTLDEEQRIVEFNKYNEIASQIDESYEFTYSGDGEVHIEQVYSSSPKSHRWVLRDSLIQEIKLLKGKKKKLKAHWQYTYRDDTLVTSIVKHDKNGYVKYQYDYEYSDRNQLTRKTVKERGKADRWLEAKYDDEGNLIGYRNEDEQRSRSGSQVKIERDSADQITSYTYQNRRGVNDRWVYEYNEAGKPVKSLLLNAQGEEERRVEYSYDADGNELQKTITEKDKVRQRLDRKYDERGNLISLHFYRRFLGDLDLIYYVLSTYDEDNRLIRKDFWNKDMTQRKRWDYEYELF